MLKKGLLLLLLAPISLLYSQVYLPGPHSQKHTLPRGAYVACVDDITADMSAGFNKKFLDLVDLVQRHELDFLAFYGLHHVIDNDPQDNPEEVQLRALLTGLRNRFPGIKIAAVGGGIQDPTAGKISAQHFEQYQTGNFIFRPQSSEACPNDIISSFNLGTLQRIMNPHNPDPTDLYKAEVVKFFARVATFYGFKDPTSQPQRQGKTGGSNRDFFDHLVLEDEWWWRGGAVRENLNEHEDLLRSMRSILHLSHACEAKVITYESLQNDTSGVTTMAMQAAEIATLADRIFVTHYFKCVPNVLERYCEAIQAWGASPSVGTEYWPLFSSEDQSARVSCSRYNPDNAWGDFWGEWMDTNYTQNNPPPNLCPNPGRPGYGYPYEASEAEDLYLERLDSAATAGLLPNSSCAQFNTGAYRVQGFMWFVAHLMDPHGRSMVSLAEIAFSPPSLYPNPSASEIRLSKGELVAVRSASGSVIQLPTQGDAWQTGQLAPGLYIAQVIHSGEVFYLKFIKE